MKINKVYENLESREDLIKRYEALPAQSIYQLVFYQEKSDKFYIISTSKHIEKIYKQYEYSVGTNQYYGQYNKDNLFICERYSKLRSIPLEEIEAKISAKKYNL